MLLHFIEHFLLYYGMGTPNSSDVIIYLQDIKTIHRFLSDFLNNHGLAVIVNFIFLIFAVLT